MEKIFRVGDTVYHWKYGKGVVTVIELDDHFAVKVLFNDRFRKAFTLNGWENAFEPPTLSHTPYDFVNGGFTQRISLPDIKKGTPVFVKLEIGGKWVIRAFSHFNEEGKLHVFSGAYLEGETYGYNEYSLENPINY